jgi:ArsR family transcriptional regulator
LAIFQRAGFVLTTRIGKWTYYRRNEQVIADFAAKLSIEL